MLREVGGRYQIQKRLGSGAWATVYDALDTGAIERHVAIKVFRLPSLGDPSAAEEHARFRQGARAAGRLSHPNVVSVFDYGEDEETAWIVMELVEGETLKSLMDAGTRLDTAFIARIMGQILDALDYTHSRGVVHRDIKPANIMLTRDRVVKITDFGVARIEDASMTHAGTVLGSPSYMAPEQFRGDPVDYRADIWAAGVILYQLLTGVRPFEGSVTSVMQKALYVDPVLPSQTQASVPPQFDAVIAKSLAKRPEARFASAAEFADALRAAAAKSEPKLKPSPKLIQAENDATLVIRPGDATFARRRPLARRRPAWVLPVAIGSVVVVLGIAGVLLLPETPTRLGTEVARAGPEAAPGPTGNLAGSPFERNLPTAPVPDATVPGTVSPPRVEEPPPLAAKRAQPEPRVVDAAPPVMPPPQLAEPRSSPVAPAPLPPAEATPFPTSPKPPPPVVALPPDLRGAAITAGAAFQCGVVRASVSADRIVFHGIAPRAEIQSAQRTIAAAGLPSRAAEMRGVEVFDSTYCGVLSRLEESLGSADAPQLTLAEPGPMPQGRILQVQVQMPDWPAHLALFALIPPGAAGQLVGTGRNAARMKLRLTDPTWEVTAPFGSGLLIAVATDRPLFTRQRSPERLDSFAAALGPALQSVRENGGRIAAQVVAFQTVPR